MKGLKKYLLLSFTILFTFALSGCVSAQSLADQDIMERVEQEEDPTIRWGVKANTNLFGYYNIAEQEIQGFDVDIAKALTDVITNGQGTAELVEVSSSTRIPLLKNGNIDAIAATMSITDERDEVVDFSDVYFNAGQSLLVHKNSDITGINSLTSDHTVVGIKGSTSSQTIKEKAPQANIIELDNYGEGFLAVQSNQADAITTDNGILLGMIDQNPNYKLAGGTFTEEPYGIAINEGQDNFRNEINAALEEIRKNGTYEEIYNKWFGHLQPQGGE